MATSYTSLLGLALPAQGESSGTWGNEVNNYITTYLDSAVAGSNAIALSADTALTKQTNASLTGSSSQYAILNVTPNASTWTLTVPAASQTYVVNNLSGTYTFLFKGLGGTTVTFAAGEKAVMAWNGSNFIKVASSAISNLTGTLPVANGGTARTVGNYSVYDNEIHVGKNGNDTTGDGTLINPVLTITKALTLIGSGKNTVVVHPGGYTENPTVSSTNTTIATSELTGANTIVYGTLTLSAAARVSGLKMTNLTITGSGNTYISNCTVDTQVVKSGTNYVEIINSELQCVSGIQISGSGVVSIVGNKCWAVAVSNASASVLIKDCYQVITPSVSAGTLQIDGSAIFAASPTSNAVTSSAGTAITLANSFVLNSAGTNVERVSLAGNYSILNLVYDKTNSTFAGTSLNAIDYFQYINADRVNFNGSTSGITGLIASAVAGTTSLTLPAATDTLVGRATTDTLTNKTLVTPALGTPTSGNLTNCTFPTLNQNTTGTAAGLSATLAVGSGGTGQTTYTDGQLLIGNTAGNTLTKATLTEGSGVTITNAGGSITIAATGSGGTVTGVTATSPVASSGGAAPVISLNAAYGDTQNPYASKTANYVLAAPNGSAGVPTFRALVAADIPTLNQNTTGTAAGLSATLAVASGGTGATTLTGIVKGNGASAFSVATAGTDYVAPGTVTSFTAKQTFSGSSSVLASVFTNMAEVATVSATAATGTINYDITTQSVLYYTSNASANWTVNFRASSGTSLDSAMSTGQSLTAAFLVTQGSTAYYNSAVQVDGTSVTPKWQGGTAPAAGNASSVDVYTYTIVKTGAAAFTVFASQTRFA